jgi:hypothetical protein
MLDMHNNHIHSDKIKLRDFAMQIYFSDDVGSYNALETY